MFLIGMRLVVLFFIFAIIGEVLARAFLTSPSQVRSDPKMGWAYISGGTVFQTREGWSVNTINSMGLNDSDPTDHPYPLNFLTVGDSFTEAIQVSRQDNFNEIAESTLGCANIINAGRMGLALTHYPLIAANINVDYPISSIVVVLNSWDLKDTLVKKGRLLKSDDGELLDIEPVFKQQTAMRQKFKIVFEYSALATYLAERLKSMLSINKVRGGKVKEVDLEKQKNEVLQFKKIFEFTLNKLQKIAPTSILYIPNLSYAADGVSNETEDSLYFGRILKEVTEKHGVGFYTTAEVLKETYQQNLRPGVGFANAGIVTGHLNDSGHKAVATVLSEAHAPACDARDIGGIAP